MSSCTDIHTLATRWFPSAGVRAIPAAPPLVPHAARPGTVGLGGATAKCPASICLKQTEAAHFGLGVLVINGWVLQNPSFSGYAAIQAYLPSKRLALAVSTTKTSTTPDGNTAEVVARRIAAARRPRSGSADGSGRGCAGRAAPLSE
ncbi:hypothetical protein [Streptomyces sp. NPDC093795]|uniref:hypothetical protein n=1 Tax=Streptomyces sp. NPDC093795 TaxID=3366051 RepID=UPI00381AA1B8